MNINTNQYLSLNDKCLEEFSSMVKQNYGYDFTQYAKSSFKRRVERLMTLSSLQCIDELTLKLKEDSSFVNSFVNEITVNTTEMFRDGSFWIYTRNLLKKICSASGEKVSVWHAGCSTGEEVISMAITIKELGIKDQVELTATDINQTVISKSRVGGYPMRNLKLYEENYRRAAGLASFQEYYTIMGDHFLMNSELLDNVEFKIHDLVRDSYNFKYDLIVCRNVFIYFNKGLQDKVFGEMTRSLIPGGYIAIGSKESIAWSRHAYKYNINSDVERIYQLRK